MYRESLREIAIMVLLSVFFGCMPGCQSVGGTDYIVSGDGKSNKKCREYKIVSFLRGLGEIDTSGAIGCGPSVVSMHGERPGISEEGAKMVVEIIKATPKLINEIGRAVQGGSALSTGEFETPSTVGDGKIDLDVIRDFRDGGIGDAD